MPRPLFQRLTSARRATLTLCVISLAALAGCAGTPGPDIGTRLQGDTFSAAPARQLELVPLASLPPQVVVQPEGVYRLGIGDVVQLHVVDEPDLTLPNGYPVEADGAIVVPFLGRVPAADRSAEDLRADLAERLRPLHTAPQVFVRITGFHARHITVVGAVRQPGRHSLTDQPMRVIDAINTSGGFLDPERPPAVTILRAGQPIAVDIDRFLADGTALPSLHDGDVVQVAPRAAFRQAPAAPSDFILHSGGTTRRHALPEGLSLAAVIAHAMPRPTDTVYLIRPEGARSVAMTGSPAQALDPAIGGRLILRPGDSIVVLHGSATSPQDHFARLIPVLTTLQGA